MLEYLFFSLVNRTLYGICAYWAIRVTVLIARCYLFYRQAIYEAICHDFAVAFRFVANNPVVDDFLKRLPVDVVRQIHLGTRPVPLHFGHCFIGLFELVFLTRTLNRCLTIVAIIHYLPCSVVENRGLYFRFVTSFLIV